VNAAAPPINRSALFEILGYEPHQGQWPIHRSNARHRIAANGRRFGKTICAAAEVMVEGMVPRDRSVGWVVAPTYDLCEKIMREVYLYATAKIPHRIVKLREHDRLLVLRNLSGGLSEIRGKSAENQKSLLGEGLDFLVIDEASRVRPDTWEAYLEPALVDKQGRSLLISTPRGKGFFYKQFRLGQAKNQTEYESWNLPSWTNPYLSKDAIETIRERVPERVFQQEYGAQFIEGAGAVFRNIQDMATGSWQEPVQGQRYYAGLDLARVEDYTVLCVVDEAGRLVFVDRFTKLDWSIQVARIKAGCDRYNRAGILVDSTGAGEPIYEALLEAGCDVQPYTYTNKSKAALIDNLALMCEQMLLVLPRADLWEIGLEELEAFEYSITDSGNVKSGAPSGIHDDCVNGLALAAWQIRPNRLAGYSEVSFF
jgi:hypothetical protein